MQPVTTSKLMLLLRRRLHKCAQVMRESAARRVAVGVGAIAVCSLWLGAARAVEFQLLEQFAEAKLDRIDRFVAADTFKLGRSIGGRRLSAIGWNFAEHFLGVVEENVPPVALKVWSLQLTIGDVALVRRLGGENGAAITSIGHIYRLMEMGDGPSHTDGRSNIAYVRSIIDQRIWAVHWSVNLSNEWTIGAVNVPHSYLDWHAETRLISR